MKTYTSSMPGATDWPTIEDYTKGMSVEEDPTAWWPSTTSTGTGTLIASSGLGSLVSSLGNTAHRQKTISDIVEQGYWIKMTGSRVTKDGWTSESDWDYVVYDPDRKLYEKLTKGPEIIWHLGGSGRGEEFVSLKQGDTNLILVDKEEIWKKYIIATNLIKTLNSKTKGERIAVFDSVFCKDSNAKAVEF